MQCGDTGGLSAAENKAGRVAKNIICTYRRTAVNSQF